MEDKFRVEIIQCDVPNKNNRVYPRHVIQSAIEKHKSGAILGMLGMHHEPYVKFSEVSHEIHDLEIEDVGGIPTLFGKVKFLDTPRGKLGKSLFDDGEFVFRISGVGEGETDNEGNLVISDSYKLVSINMVPAEPESIFYRLFPD